MNRTLSVLMVLALTLVPVAALGATSTTTPATVASGSITAAKTPGPFATPTEMQVQLWPSEVDGAVLIISMDLAPDAALPATVRIPLPDNATPGWVGEISSAGLDSDIKRDYTLEQGTGGRMVVFRIEKFRSAQIEASYTEPQVIGDKLVSTLEWVQSAPAPVTNFSVKMAPNTKDVAVDPVPTGAPQSNDQGERLYTVAASPLKPGAKFAVTVAYRSGAAPTTAGGVAAGGQTLLIVVVILLAAAVAVLILMVVRARGRQRIADASDPSRPSGRRTEAEESADEDPFDVDME